MKIIIAGGRDIHINSDLINGLLYHFAIMPAEITEIICGCASGIDTAGKDWAIKHNIYVKEFPADWNKHGKSAGHKRNKQMAEYGDRLLLIWDGKSKGSVNMKKQMRQQIKPINEIILK